jgi:hypothetical protein
MSGPQLSRTRQIIGLVAAVTMLVSGTALVVIGLSESGSNDAFVAVCGGVVAVGGLVSAIVLVRQLMK